MCQGRNTPPGGGGGGSGPPGLPIIEPPVVLRPLRMRCTGVVQIVSNRTRGRGVDEKRRHKYAHNVIKQKSCSDVRLCAHTCTCTHIHTYTHTHTHTHTQACARARMHIHIHIQRCNTCAKPVRSCFGFLSQCQHQLVDDTLTLFFVLKITFFTV